MVRIVGRLRGPRLFFLLLVMLLVTGHVCDLTAYVERVAPLHEAEHSHHPGEGHGSEELTSCDAVDAIPSSPNCIEFGTGPDVLVAALDTVVEPTVRSAGQCLESGATIPNRPPLFLLHASLLI